MKIVLLDTNGLGEDIDLSPLARVGTLVQYYATDYDVLPQRIADADVIVTNKLKLNRDNLAGAASLKLICVTATGFDGILTLELKNRNMPGRHTHDIYAHLDCPGFLNLAHAKALRVAAMIESARYR